VVQQWSLLFVNGFCTTQNHIFSRQPQLKPSLLKATNFEIFSILSIKNEKNLYFIVKTGGAERGGNLQNGL